MPNSATEKLTKILKLEAERGYQDKAVTRGLASFANAWLADAAKSNIDSTWAQSVADEMRAYSAASDTATRRTALNAIVTRLHSPVLSTPGTHTPSTLLSGAREPVAPPVRNLTKQSVPQYTERPAPARRTRPEPACNRHEASSGASAGTSETGAEAPARGAPAHIPVVSEPDNSALAALVKPLRPVSARRQLEQLQPRQSSHKSTVPRYPGLGLDAPASSLNGIGNVGAQRLAKLGVATIRDLLYFFPTRYDDYSALKTINQLNYGESVTVVGRIATAWKHRTKTGLYLIRITLEDQSGSIDCTWFTSERAVDFMMKNLQVGREIVISGKVTEYLGKLTFQSPSQEPAEKEWVVGGSIVPVYRLTEGLQPLLVRRIMKHVIDYWPPKLTDYMPSSVRQSVGFMSLPDALREIHWPHDFDMQERARRRLAFDELFTLQMAILKQRQDWRGEPAQPLAIDDNLLQALKTSLPYSLTGAQEKATNAIVADLRKPNAMHRLLQGDVGSGKTVVATLAIVLAVNAGAQSALMAPTEILAEQHYKNLKTLFDAMAEKGIIQPVQVCLLTGSVKASDKHDIYASLADGSVQVAIGTHALIQEGVTFNNLGLVVVDEQHRFGVEQRQALRAKGREANPHSLIMTATPIPRTLSLTLYGDLDNTILDEMPPGRQPIATHWFPPTERERAYSFVSQQVSQGRQAFIICPLVEESEKVEAKAAIEEHARLQREVFPKLKLGLLHGRMKASEKESVMSAFAHGDLDILVSTSVVEVGIDVPNASVMMIEGANRFGLSQLHQFRGRVGRGQYHSYCLLIADTSAAISDERLEAIVSTQDGFKLAEKDLEIRGPGEFFGTRQSGEPELKLVNIRDRDLLLIAREQAEIIFERDPGLGAPELQPLVDKITAFWSAHENHGDAS
jgi:ATP-dependent DNA helicase RecG